MLEARQIAEYRTVRRQRALGRARGAAGIYQYGGVFGAGIDALELRRGLCEQLVQRMDVALARAGNADHVLQ